MTFVYVELSSHEGRNEKLLLNESDGCRPGSTWYSRIVRMASLSLFANIEPMGELGILVKASSLGARIVMSFWNDRFAYTSPKLSIRAANWVMFELPLRSCVRSCVCCCANTVHTSERRKTSVVRILDNHKDGKGIDCSCRLPKRRKFDRSHRREKMGFMQRQMDW